MNQTEKRSQGPHHHECVPNAAVAHQVPGDVGRGFFPESSHGHQPPLGASRYRGLRLDVAKTRFRNLCLRSQQNHRVRIPLSGFESRVHSFDESSLPRVIMIRWEEANHSLAVKPLACEFNQSRQAAKNRRKGPAIGRLYNHSRRWNLREISGVKAFVPMRRDVQRSARRNGLRDSQLGLIQQRLFPFQQRTELLGPVVSGNQTGHRTEPFAVASRR